MGLYIKSGDMLVLIWLKVFYLFAGTLASSSTTVTGVVFAPSTSDILEDGEELFLGALATEV